MYLCITKHVERWLSRISDGWPCCLFDHAWFVCDGHPFFIALWQALKLLSLIDKNTAFSDAAVNVLKNIKRCAIIIAVLYVGGVPLLYPIADAEDAPGLIIIGMIIACAPVTLAVFAAVLQKLLESAINIKSENDLTV